MKVSERIKLIKSIAEFLADENWRIIDLTLRQFGLPTADTWESGDRDGYVIEMINNATDAVLVDLAKHVGVAGEFESATEPDFWADSDPRIFICHLAKEKVCASSLRDEFEKFGVVGFVAHEDIEPSREWQNEIELALGTMDGLVALMHPGFHESKWTDQEIGVAIGRRVPIIPIKLGIDPYGFIGKYQALNASKMSPSDLALNVIELFASKPQIASKISRSLVGKLKRSPNWAKSKLLMDLIERCQQFTPEVLAELTNALEKNDQVSSAWGVPERIKQIISQYKT